MPDTATIEERLRKAIAMSKTGVIWYYRVGCCVAELTESSEYGASCVDAIAGPPGPSRASLYLTRKLVKTYPGKELDSVKPLPWSVVKVLLTVNDSAMRLELQQKAVAGRWSSRRLRQEIGARKGYPERKVTREYKDEHKGRDLKRLAVVTRAWQQVVKNNWPADRIRKLRPDGAKLAELVECASELLQVILQATDGR